MNEDHQKEAATHQVEGARPCGSFAELQQMMLNGSPSFAICNEWGGGDPKDQWHQPSPYQGEWD